MNPPSSLQFHTPQFLRMEGEERKELYAAKAYSHSICYHVDDAEHIKRAVK